MPRILQLSDPHVVAPPGLLSKRFDSLALFAATIDHILDSLPKIGPLDGIIVTGDLVDQGDLESYQAFRGQIERLGLPYFLIPGNHDGREAMRTCFADLEFVPQRGQFDWVRDFDGLRLIGLDTLIQGQGGGRLSPTSLDFLDQALLHSPNIAVLIAMHHPPFMSGLPFMDCIGLNDFQALEKMLQAADNNIRIICGHLHNVITAELGGRTVVAGASCISTFPIDYREDAPGGFNTLPVGYMLHEWEMGFRSTYVPMMSGSGPHPF
ncbi:MAG: phosphodiesterase [Pseudomonadota bacterium]